MGKLCKNDFSRVVPGPLGSQGIIVESAKLRHIFFTFDQFWESLGIREISEKLAILAIMSVTKVHFFTLHCAFLELILELKHFSKKDIKSDVELKEQKNLLISRVSQNPLIPRLSEFPSVSDFFCNSKA